MGLNVLSDINVVANGTVVHYQIMTSELFVLIHYLYRLGYEIEIMTSYRPTFSFLFSGFLIAPPGPFLFFVFETTMVIEVKRYSSLLISIWYSMTSLPFSSVNFPVSSSK
ncbi:hypothetical protein K501DRAFT_315009 [Backusella circina FSU 941]|nr:hypothetical protein K501DRAFT_315009 [Backusella circina FSU 941]